MSTRSLTRAKAVKDDEFYTRPAALFDELPYWDSGHFEDKIVYLPCDEGEKSVFWNCFLSSAEELGIKELHCTSLAGYHLKYTLGKGIEKRELQSGDFRSAECVEIMKGCDIVVTNPPFSLWREFLAQILSLGKKFLILGTETNLSTVSVFSLYKDGVFGLGKNRGGMGFSTPDGEVRKFGNICWYQNLDVGRVFEDSLRQGSTKYHPENYEKYSNLDVLFVRRVKDIPVDYDGLMGVPVSYLPIWNKEKHELVARIHDKQWLVSQGVPRMGEEIVRRVLEQGNASHFSANMVYPYLERDGKIVFPFLQIVIRNKR